MPVKGIRGDKLAQEILRLSEQLEGDFRREFFDEIAAYADNAAIKRLLKDIDSGKFTASSSVSSALEKVVFASDRLDAIARKAMGKSARISGKVTLGFEPSFNVINPEVVSVARTMSINLSTALNKSTKEVLRKIIQDTVEGNLTVIQASRKIRNHVGLLPAHSDAVDRYYETLVQSGAKVKIAQQQADAYAQRLLKYRSETIARTEVARAVGEGQTAMWKQMIQDGYLPTDVKRVWITHIDERTCQICEPMNGVEADVYGSWDTQNGIVQFPALSHPNCRCSSGIVMPKASRSKIGKTSELELSQWLLSKYNPNHDELGRFTSGPGGVRSLKPKMTRRQLGLSGKKTSIIRYSSDERKKAVEALAANGSDKLLMPRHPDTGIAQVLTEDKANKRYGRTVAQVKNAIKKLGVEEITVTKGFAEGPDAVRQMHGVAQAVEEAKRMGIPINKLKVRLTTALTTEDGAFSSYIDSVHEGTIEYDYQGGKRVQRLADQSNKFSVSVQSTPEATVSRYTTDYPLDISAGDNSTRYAYAVMIHEIGHLQTIHTANNPNNKRQFNIQSPSLYGDTLQTEKLAESFSAWWLLGGSKGKTRKFYQKWTPFVESMLNGTDDGFSDKPSKLLKVADMKRIVLDVHALPPNNPLIVFLTDGASLPDDVEKYNMNHDELGRFASGSSSTVGSTEVGRGVISSSAALLKNLTTEERAALSSYTRMGYTRINDHLRYRSGNEITDPKEKFIGGMRQEKVKVMDSIFDKISVPCRENMVVYRGMALAVTKKDVMQSWIGKLKVGGVIEDKGFVSTGINQGTAESFARSGYSAGVLFVIKVPKGTRSMIGSFSEQELILNRGSKFRITSIKVTPPSDYFGSEHNVIVNVELI